MKHLWYKRYPSDFLNGIDGLDLNSIGCYAIILDMIYDRGGPVPYNPRLIAGKANCSTRLAKVLINRLIELGKLIHTTNGLSNTRAEIEMAKLCHLRDSATFRGSKGGRERAVRAGNVLHFNKDAQAGLKHARAKMLDKKERKKESEEGSAMKAANKEASKKENTEEEIIASPALLAKYTNRKAPPIPQPETVNEDGEIIISPALAARYTNGRAH